MRSSLIRGEWGWGLIRATLPDPPQTLAASPSHPPLLTIIVTLAEQLQESEQVLGEFIICHDLLSWVGGLAGHGAEEVRCARPPESVHTAHAHCTHMHRAPVCREQQPPFKDTMRAMGIHDASGPNLRVQDISRRRLRGPES